MTEKQNLIESFIENFYEKAKTKRRHQKNTLVNIQDLTNKVLSKYFDADYYFNDDELINAFEKKGYSILEPKEKNILGGTTKKGKVEFSKDNFINIKSQNISDLVLSLRKGFPLDSNPDTVDRIHNLKESLKEFAEKN